jgi:hypothetical protein
MAMILPRPPEVPAEGGRFARTVCGAASWDDCGVYNGATETVGSDVVNRQRLHPTGATFRFSGRLTPRQITRGIMAASGATVAGRKPPRMGGLNRVVSLGMDFLRTSKKIFFSWFPVACDGRLLLIFKLPVLGGVATAALILGGASRLISLPRRWRPPGWSSLPCGKPACGGSRKGDHPPATAAP